MQRHETPQQRDSASAVVALIAILATASMVAWFALGRAQRMELEFLLLRANQGALAATAVGLAGAVTMLVLAVRRKSRFLTTAVAEAHSEFAPALAGRDRVLVYLPHVALTVLAWGAYAYSYAAGETRWIFLGMLAAPGLAPLRAALVAVNGAVIPALIPAYVAALLNGSGLTRWWRATLLARREGQDATGPLPAPGDYQAGRDKPVFLLGARETRASRRFEPDAAIPSWVTLGAPGVFGGVLVLGRKGAGKTALLLRMVEDALRFRADDEALKPALCVIDQKGDLAEFVVEKARLHGRAADVTRLGVGTVAKWNPFGALGPTSTALDCRQVGFFMRCAMTAGTTTSSEGAFWQDNADNLIFRCAHLLALAGEPVGFGSVYQLMTSATAKASWRHELVTRAEAILNARETQGADVADARDELRDTDRYFEDDFTKLDPKIRTTIVSVVSNFHQKFMTAEYARSFGCPAATPGHFGGFRDLIANGRIFVLDVRSNEHGTVANALAMLAKLYYQAAVKTRDRFPGDAGRRATMFVMDEAQSCVTPSTASTEGDDKYLETSRSFKAIDVYATQQYSSFAAAVGKDMAQRIIGSFNNLVVYRHNDPALTEYLQKNVGQHERDERSVSVTESSGAAERNVLAVEGETERDRQVSRSVSVQRRERQVIEAATFRDMSVFEALGFFDAPGGLVITHFFTKPHFVDARTPHAEVLRKIQEAA